MHQSRQRSGQTCWVAGLLAAVLLQAVTVQGGDTTPATAGKTSKTDRKVQRLLLIGQGPDKHTWSTHEYMAATRVLAALLQKVDRLQTVIVKADEPWREGPELLDGADGVVVFVSEGAKWLQQDQARTKAFNTLASRGGGLTVLHWGMGCRQARYIDTFVKLFGGCHGGPDRRYKVVSVRTEIAARQHPVMSAVRPYKVDDEFYYTLKFAKSGEKVTPLLKVPIEGTSHTVAWAWNRTNGGRSFGFSGCHFHRNWKLEEYRRMVAQGILWTLKRRIPREGFPVDVTGKDLQIQRPKPADKQQRGG